MMQPKTFGQAVLLGVSTPAVPRPCANDCGALADPDRLDPFCSDECRAEEEERRRWERIEQRRVERRG